MVGDASQVAILVPDWQSEMQSQRILWVKVQAEHPVTALRQESGEMRGEGRLADPAFWGNESDQGHKVYCLQPGQARRGGLRSGAVMP